MQLIISRYHQFVKPAFDEYIRPTRKFADIIIPRGLENKAAIELVSQHLNLQLKKNFLDRNEIDYNPNTSLFNSINEMIDPKYQFFEKKIKLPEDSNVIETLKLIFDDFIRDKESCTLYSDLILDDMMNNLFSLIKPRIKYDIILTENDVVENLELKRHNKIFYFKSAIMYDSDLELVE